MLKHICLYKRNSKRNVNFDDKKTIYLVVNQKEDAQWEKNLSLT